MEYPEAEYHKNDNTRKWVRRLYQSVMNVQLFPVYTSMENMTTDPHKLTVKEMKGITFQVIPQFYWKYEWSFNDHMIHRVGKLNPPNPELPMYDMLGNVWELVRDDWSPSVKVSLNGKTNPIVGNKENVPTASKVIKGGAFDQTCRNVVSASREEISMDSNKSKHGKSPNVGFRPAMTFTAEDDGDVSEGTQEPIDLFFLFDASSSQDSQID